MEDQAWDAGIDIDAELAKVNRELDDVQAKLAEVDGRGEGAKGLVTVRVGADGRLLDLRLDPRALRLGSHALAAAIMEAANSAADQTAGRMREIMAPFADAPFADVNRRPTR
ncbi:YbaB/EbfC family nucleoid-associated protein [Nonomuraea sp. NPDC049400]|uniref:YbaB/EbfC family nucleoid-associated protein n=1 Tax=Nonomuraea sp. NPDC049400 TaxID=3364352 RepID=UPI0037AE7B6F